MRKTTTPNERLAAQSAITKPVSWRQFYSERRFAILLGILVTLLIIPGRVYGANLSMIRFERMLSLIVFVAVLALCAERRHRVFALLTGLPSIVLSLGSEALPLESAGWVRWLGYSSVMLFLFGAAAVIVRALFRVETLALDGILGSVCGYLFLGLGWATLFSLIEMSRPGSFAWNTTLPVRSDVPDSPLPELTYFSFVTLTTVGYGDVSPTGRLTRTLSWMEAITGQFYLAVVVAGVVTLLLARSRRPARSTDHSADPP